MSTRLMDLATEARRSGLWCDWRDGPGIGAVLVTGADAAAFLQAQLTSDVEALGPGNGQMSARLNRRGQLTAWFSLHRLPERGQPYATYLLLVPVAGIAALVEDLTAFVIGADVLLEDVSADFGGLVWQQPVAAELESPLLPEFGPDAAAAVGSPREHELIACGVPQAGEVWLIRRSLTGDPGWILLQPGGLTAPLQAVVARAAADRHLVRIGPDDVPEAEVWAWLAAEAGWPVLGRDLPGGARTLPQTGLDHQVVSFTKGCYLGQEVVARLRTYGSVPEALRVILWDGLECEERSHLPGPGEPLLGEDGKKSGVNKSGVKKIGTWSTSFWSPVLQRTASLAFLDREHRTPGDRLEVDWADGDLAGEVALLPLHMGTTAAERAVQVHDRALAQFSAGRDEQAVALLEEAIRLDPTRGEAFEALGVILGRLQKFHEAIGIFRRLEEIAPGEPMVHTNLSLFYMQIGEKDEAERQKALATLKKFGGDVDAPKAEALARQERASRREEAERKRTMYAEVLEIDPDDALALMGMGQSLAVLEDLPGAAAHLERALAAQADNSVLYAAYARVLADLGRSDEAAAVYRRGITVASRRGDLMPLREMEHRLRLLPQ